MSSSSLFVSLAVFLLPLSGAFTQFFLLLFIISIIIFKRELFHYQKESLFAYLSLNGIFFWLLLVNITSHDFVPSILDLGPMIPMLVVGSLAFVKIDDRPSLIRNINLAAVGGLFFLFSLFIVAPIIPRVLEVGFDTNFYSSRFEGFAGNAIPLSFVVSITAILAIFNIHKADRIGSILGASAFAIAIYLVGWESQSRGPTIGIFSVLAFLLAFNFFRMQKKYFIYGAVFVTIFCVIVAAQNPNFFIPDRLLTSVTSYLNGKHSHSDELRFQMWDVGIGTLKENPFFGTGSINRVQNAIEGKEQYIHLARFKHLHNDLITSGVSGGLLGAFLSFVSLLSPVIAWLLMRRKSSEGLILAASTVLIIFSTALSNTVLFHDSLAAVTAFVVVLIVWIEKPSA